MDLDQRIYAESGYEDENWYQDLLLKKINVIGDFQKKRRRYEIINRQIETSFTYRDLNELLSDIYLNRQNAFKINIGFGFILVNPNTNKSKYYFVSRNNMLFENAVMISNKKDLSDLMKHIVSLDLPTSFYMRKCSSGYVLADVTNVEIIIIDIKDIAIGNPPTIPEHIKSLCSLNTLDRNENTGKCIKTTTAFLGV